MGSLAAALAACQAQTADDAAVVLDAAMVEDAATGNPADASDGGCGEVLMDLGLGDGPDWTERFPIESPPPRFNSAIAYDERRGRVVLYGGATWEGNPPNKMIAPTLQDTWEWCGLAWQQVPTPHSPGVLTFHTMAFDSERGVVVLHGGFAGLSCGSVSNETWEYDGRDWQLAATGPARGTHVMAYDPRNHMTVLFGGGCSSTSNDTVNETWAYQKGGWQRLTPTMPPPARREAGMVYDAERQVLVLFGGIGADNAVLDDTWTFDGQAWSPVTSAKPPARLLPAMAFDARRRRVVLFGGTYPRVRDFNDTWEWSGGDWVQRMVPHPPSLRDGHVMVYSSANREVVLFGGNGGGAALRDTWTLDIP